MQNSNAKEDCHIFLTKPLGIGILSTAQKQKKIEEGHIDPAIKAMITLNKIGADLAKLDGVIAMTDVTGFGLLGHLVEICEASKISAEINFEKVPLLPNVEKYRQLGCIPGGAKKNFLSYGSKISDMTQEQREILCDAQTSGGLLVMVETSALNSFMQLTQQEGLALQAIGKTTLKGENVVEVL